MSEESLFREVDEEIRREQLKSLWNRFGPFVIAACIAVVLGVAGYKGWEYWQHRQALSAGEQYMAALNLAEQGRMGEASTAFAELAEGSGGYATLARLQEAAALAAQGRTDEAVAAYDAVAERGAMPVLSNLARVRAGLLLVDTAPVAELESRVGALDQEGNPWRNAAREILALGAYRAGGLQRADALFNEILADPAAPIGLRQRAQVMLGLIAPQLGKTAGGGGAGETAETPEAAAIPGGDTAQ